MKKGFTLLELLIVVIVIGILAGVAIPQYLKVVERGKVAKAKNNLALIAQAEKMYRTEHTSYTSDISLLDDWIEGLRTTDDDWDYTVEDIDDPDTFTAKATRKGSGGDYGGTTVTINQINIVAGDHLFH